MSRYNVAMNNILTSGETLKTLINRMYNEYKQDYELYSSMLTKKHISCRIILIFIKILCSLYKNDYIGYSKYLIDYKQLINNQIDDMLFEHPTNNVLNIITSDITTEITGETEQLRVYSDYAKQNIISVETMAKAIFGKI